MVLLDKQYASSVSMGLPAWLKQDLPDLKRTRIIKNLLSRTRTTTVCQAARCPNTGKCWGRGVATFMISGEICTRGCRFCAVTTGQPAGLDPDEPRRIAAAIKEIGLRFVVITSVTRDDLKDGGAQQFVDTVFAIRRAVPRIKIELLIPDFGLDRVSVDKIVHSGADVIGHNMETVSRLYPRIRPQADYACSLEVLRTIKKLNPSVITKSGFMVGLGETGSEIRDLLKEMRDTDCDMVTIGQYLRPLQTGRHVAVERYVPLKEFDRYQIWAEALGFRHVQSAPLVRSSFLAEEGYQNCLK